MNMDDSNYNRAKELFVKIEEEIRQDKNFAEEKKKAITALEIKEILVDGIDYIVHIFVSDARRRYGLENLWSELDIIKVG